MLADSIVARQIELATFNFQERFLECGIVSLLGAVPGFGSMPIAVADLAEREEHGNTTTLCCVRPR
jgi:hypothetical protein